MWTWFASQQLQRHPKNEDAARRKIVCMTDLLQETQVEVDL